MTYLAFFWRVEERGKLTPVQENGLPFITQVNLPHEADTIADELHIRDGKKYLVAVAQSYAHKVIHTYTTEDWRQGRRN